MNRIIVFVTILGLTVIAIGCSRDQVTDKVGTTNNTLEQEFDGLNTSSESPAFGDETLISGDNQETAYPDSIIGSSLEDSLMRNPEVQVFHFRALWGRLQPDSTVTTRTDWTGSLTLSRGIEILRRVIRFEPGTDSILPRTEKNVIEWISVTATHSDGIAVDLVIPKPRPVVDTLISYVTDSAGDSTQIITLDTLPVPAVELEFKTGPYTRVFSLEELANLDTVVSLSDSNEIAFSAFQMTKLPCPRGFLTGFWGYDSTGTGVFRGSWIGQRWEVQGYFQGHFKTDSTGQNVFVGKWIDKLGAFEGFLKGRWDEHPNDHANQRAFERAGGWFAGEIFNANADPIGVLKGKYKTGDEDAPGFLQGRWKLYCPGDAENDSEQFDDGMSE